MKRRGSQKNRRHRYIRILVCAQCGIEGPHWRFRQCGRCKVDLHVECVVHHHVDHAGDGVHAARDYSHLTHDG